MPEAITPASEKLVPIDTSGNAVDVTLKEDKKDDVVATTNEESPIVEVQEEQSTEVVQETAPQENKEEDLEEYSAGVKKRIDKLTKKMREAERREQAAVDYAKKVKEENDKIRNTSVVQNDSMLVEREKALVNQKEFAKRAMEAAIQAQDVEKQVAAQQALAKIELDKEKLRASERRIERESAQASPEQVEFEQQIQPQQTQQPVSQPSESPVPTQGQGMMTQPPSA